VFRRPEIPILEQVTIVCSVTSCSGVENAPKLIRVVDLRLQASGLEAVLGAVLGFSWWTMSESTSRCSHTVLPLVGDGRTPKAIEVRDKPGRYI